MKKIKRVQAVFLICFFSMSLSLFSQENNKKHNDATIQNASKKSSSSEDSQLKTKVSTSPASTINNNVQPQVDTQGKSFQLDENDAYQGRKEEFLSQLTVKELPSDFPKYEKWMGVRHYNEAITDYYKKHLDILIPSVRQKISQIH